MSLVTGIEYLSKTRTTFSDEVSFANKGLKLNTKEDVKEINEKIIQTKIIKALRLEGNTISPAAAEELAKALEKHPELERFIGNDIFTGRLKDEIPLALKSICGAFQASGVHLVEINLSDNAFGPIGLDALVSFFQSNTCFSLREIRMHNNGLGPEGAKKFANALESCYKNSGSKLQLKVFICGRNRLELEGSKAISNVLKMIGTLEEIQMPQNGIRPNGIENIADALANNQNLKIINLNDNTFTKKGGVAISKALIKLNNLEYINFGDCLLRSKGALALVRSLINNKKLKEVILSFNEIDAATGQEISAFLLDKKNNFDSLKFVDLNGNKFGEDVKIDIINMFSKNPNVLGTLSEDEGEDDEEELDEEDEVGDEDEEDEEENEEDEYDYDDEDDDDDQYEDYEDDENGVEDDEEDENEEAEIIEKYGHIDLNQQNIQSPPRENLFANLINQQKQQSVFPAFSFNQLQPNNLLFSTQKNPLDEFVKNSNLDLLNFLTQEHINSYFQSNNYDSTSLLAALYQLSKLMNQKQDSIQIIFNHTNRLVKAYFTNQNTSDTFASLFLTYFGLLKSEDKKFKPAEIDENFNKLLTYIFKENLMPKNVKDNIVTYLKISSKGAKNQNQLLSCFN